MAKVRTRSRPKQGTVRTFDALAEAETSDRDVMALTDAMLDTPARGEE